MEMSMTLECGVAARGDLEIAQFASKIRPRARPSAHLLGGHLAW